MGQAGHKTQTALNMYSKRAPGNGAGACWVLLFSLAGVRAMLGFFAKLGVWQAGVDAGLIWLVVASAVRSASRGLLVTCALSFDVFRGRRG